MKRLPHTLPPDDVIAVYDTHGTLGLSSHEAARRLRQDGPNALSEPPGPTLLLMLWRQLTEPLVIVLFVAALVSGALGQLTDAAVILLIVLVNGFLGVWQERKAEQSLAALRRLGSAHARVVRDGDSQNIAATELVRGDVVLIEEGDFIPADGRLVETVNLAIDESALTGESIPVEKIADPIQETDVSIGDRMNMVYKSTVVTYGRGRVIITSTGMKTEIGKIAELIQQVPDVETPLQKRLATLGKSLGLIALGLVLLIFVEGILRGNDPFEMFMTSVSLAVAAIPEGLPTIVTIVLALGVQRMSQRRAIIRKLPAVESLGSATVICSDKTGTLTQNQMTVQKMYVSTGFRDAEDALDPLSNWLALGGVLANNASILSREGAVQVVGDPTEGALVMFASLHNFDRDRLASTLPRIAEAPFDSVRKRMTTLHRYNADDGNSPWLIDYLSEGAWVTFTKGAPDLMLARSSHHLTREGIKPLGKADRAALVQANEDMAKQALRVLAVGMRIHREEPPHHAEKLVLVAEDEMIFLGLVGMMDPPRPEVRDAIAVCRNAGIRPIMITGDHLVTAQAVGQDLGLFTEIDQSLVGKELEAMTDEALQERVQHISVFARVSPEHKVRIVNALRANNEIVAMTGDGVNDAPALRQAHIGAAMGITGTDVAKEAADMILADDNFATIVAAVSEGRTIFTNIKKAIRYLLSCNTGELAAIFLAILFGWPRPLLAVQILWVNLVTDGLPALALGVEPAEPAVMHHPPRHPDEKLFSRQEARSIIAEGLWISTVTLVAFWLGWKNDGSIISGRTMAFGTIAFAQLFQAFNSRSETPLTRLGLFSNKSMNWAVLISALLQLLVMTVPSLQAIFGTRHLTAPEWVIMIILSATIMLFGSARKSLAVHARMRAQPVH